MNLLKRATLVTFVAGSGLLIATTGAAAAATMTTTANGIGQHGVLGDSQNDQTGEQGAKQNDQVGLHAPQLGEQPRPAGDHLGATGPLVDAALPALRP